MLMTDKGEYMERIKGKYGFGFMRLPRVDDKVDIEHSKRMVDAFLEGGFNYFDVAHPYINETAEELLKECLTSRYPRDSYVLTNKLTSRYVNCKEDIYPMLKLQLEKCGVDYFDFYLLHSVNSTRYRKFRDVGAFDELFRMKREGLVRYVGLSFHDMPEVLDEILTDYPDLDVVQIQLNYFDYDNPTVLSRQQYEVCVMHNKPVIVMEPCTGGALTRLPDEAAKVFRDLGDASLASYGIRFAASLDNVMMVLSGVSSYEQTVENCAFMRDFKKLEDFEYEAINKAVEIIKSYNLIQCTACGYCLDGCPMGIRIPEIFSIMNAEAMHGDSFNPGFYYRDVYGSRYPLASECIECGQCESVCPQKLPIRKYLKEATEVFRK